MTDEQKLFSDFTPGTASDWEERARKDLRDTPLESLYLNTHEGIRIKPFYTREDIEHLPLLHQQPGSYPFMRGTDTTKNTWLNIQQVKAVGSGKLAIDKATDAVKRGADGIEFIVQSPLNFDVAYLAGELDLTACTVIYTLQEDAAAFMERLAKQLKENGTALEHLRGAVSYDLLTGNGALTAEEVRESAQVLQLTGNSPHLYGLTVDSTRFSSLGASFTQEIALTLNAAVSYIDRLTEAGVPVEAVLRSMRFYMASGTNYFFEIVKLRVVRLLWAAVVAAYKADTALAARLHIHSSSSSWQETTLDPHVNMLRVTTEAMAAIMAGCNALTVTPYDNAFQQSGEFSERIARNVSTILKEEAYLDKAIDPAAGSYYLETLTQELASLSWELFQEVEAKGGFEAAYESGFILGSITEVSRKKFRNIATGREVLVGTNKFPNPTEQISFNPEELIQSARFDTTRAAYPTEVMRMATELHLRKRKRRPKAVIALIGHTEKQHVNASFAEEFFSCAGFETERQAYESAAEASGILLHAAAEVVVVAASEAAYAREFAPKLKEHATKPAVILADDPKHMKADLLEQGFDNFIFEDCDTSELQKIVYKRLEL